MELRTILITLMTIVIVGIVMLLVYEFVYNGGSGGVFSSNPVSPVKTSAPLIDALHDGRDYLKIDTTLPQSKNEENGIEFSFAASIYVDDYDWTPSSSAPIVFVKGSSDLSRQSPSVTLRKNRNEIHIVQDTYNSTKPGVVVIRNLPASKIISLVITIKQQSMDVYVNGTLHTHLTLAALPMQNTGSVMVGDNGGWSGAIGNFTYYNYALSYPEIQALNNKRPQRNPNDIPASGAFFGTEWWVRPL